MNTARQELGDVTFERIEVVPFALERFGTTFGLVHREPEDEDDPRAVKVQPGSESMILRYG